MKPDNILISRANDLASKAAKSGQTASKFLTPAEAQSIAQYFSRRHDITLTLDGGFENAERTRAIFINSEWGKYERSELFAALKISYRPQDTLGHRDILGALMGLGIERDTIGDIVAVGQFHVLICLPELGGFIADNLIKAGRVGIHVSNIELDELPAREEKLTEKTDTVASLRLDAVLCATFGLSRTKAAELITAGLVSLNHQNCLRPDKEIDEQALLSIRGYGRAKLLEIGGVSRKGRTFIRVGVYGR